MTALPIDDGEPLRTVEQLRDLRLRAGIKVIDLAQRAGYSDSQISYIEHGRHSPRFRTLIDLIEAMGYELIVRRKAK